MKPDDNENGKYGFALRLENYRLHRKSNCTV